MKRNRKLDRFPYKNTIINKVVKGKFFLKVKRKGITLMEAITTLFIFTLVTLIMMNIYGNTMGSYFTIRAMDHEAIAIYEALMYIDYYVNYCGEDYYIKDSRLYVEGEKGERQDYFYLHGLDLRMAYKNSSGIGYTSQPLLYEVKDFNLRQQKGVTFIEITTKKGQKIRKAIGRV